MGQFLLFVYDICRYVYGLGCVRKHNFLLQRFNRVEQAQNLHSKLFAYVGSVVAVRVWFQPFVRFASAWRRHKYNGFGGLPCKQYFVAVRFAYIRFVLYLQKGLGLEKLS